MKNLIFFTEVLSFACPLSKYLVVLRRRKKTKKKRFYVYCVKGSYNEIENNHFPLSL